MKHARKTKAASARGGRNRTIPGSTVLRPFGRNAILLGDVVEAAFDNAAFVTRDPAQQVALATSHIGRVLGRLREPRVATGLTGA
jgi:hypothetical protein